MNEFSKFMHATMLVGPDTYFYLRSNDWSDKRKVILVQLHDIPALVEAHKARKTNPHKGSPHLSIIDATPTVRLVNACEAAANGLYSLSEVAASFANRASQGRLPSSFNATRKLIEDGRAPDLETALGDLQWYRKIRELRTEWAHHSSLTIGGDDNQAIQMFVRSHRRRSDQTEFAGGGTTFCTIDEFVVWVRNALQTLDLFAGYLLKNYVVPKFNLDESFVSALRDESGMPILTADLRFETETITVREWLRRAQIID